MLVPMTATPDPEILAMALIHTFTQKLNLT